MNFTTLQNIAIADLQVEGCTYPLERYKTLIGILKHFTVKDTKKLVAKIINDYNNNCLFDDKEHISLRNNYDILGSGSFGIVFSTHSEYCVKLIFKDTGEKEYRLPKTLIESNSDIEDYVINPICYLNLNFSGLVCYFSLYYSLYVILLHSVYDQELNTHEFLSNLKKLKHDWNLTSLKLEPQHKYLFYSILNKYIKLQHIDFFDHIELMCDVLKPGQPINGSLLVMKEALLSSEQMKVNASGQFDIQGYCPYSEENTKMFRIITMHVFLFILQSNKNIRFIHKDLKPNNILVFDSNPYYLEYENIKFLFKNNYRMCIHDFGISTILACDKPSGIARDVHFFVHSLFYFFKNQYQHDIEFFQALYDFFIAPYCNTNYNLIARKTENKYKQCCNKGQLPINISYPIGPETLTSFLKFSYFEDWRVSTSSDI